MLVWKGIVLLLLLAGQRSLHITAELLQLSSHTLLNHCHITCVATGSNTHAAQWEV
jgi:hypothetical protein